MSKHYEKGAVPWYGEEAGDEGELQLMEKGDVLECRGQWSMIEASFKPGVQKTNLHVFAACEIILRVLSPAKA